MAKTTQAERDRNEHRNIRVVNDFKNHWDDLGHDLRKQSLGLLFNAQVQYTSPVATIVENTEVRISLSGYGTDGQIDLYETEVLVAEKFHTSMSPAFGKFTLDKASGSLIITNTSPKMGGTYSVRILPLV